MVGTITFRPIEANLTLNDQDMLGKMDPYVEFTVGDQKVRSLVCNGGGNNPQWKDAVTIQSTGAPVCLVQVKDKDILLDDKLGSFEVDLRDLESYGRIKKWYPIFNAKQQPTGELLLEAVFKVPTVGSMGVSQPLTTSQTTQNQVVTNPPIQTSGAFIGGAVPVTHTTQNATYTQNATHTTYTAEHVKHPEPEFLGSRTIAETHQATHVETHTHTSHTTTQQIPIGAQSTYITGQQQQQVAPVVVPTQTHTTVVPVPVVTHPTYQHSASNEHAFQAPIASSQQSGAYSYYDDNEDEYYALEALMRGVDPRNMSNSQFRSSQLGTSKVQHETITVTQSTYVQPGGQGGLHQHEGHAYPSQQMTYGHGHHDPNDANKVL